MIVSCPACSARYRIDSSKIAGRGAKITCPRCSHKFVVYKDGQEPPGQRTGATSAGRGGSSGARSQPDIRDQDFRRVGVTWRVRQGVGITYSFHDLRTLLRYLDEGKIQGRDSLSYDSNTWVPIDSIDDLELYFRDTWRKGERGEIGLAPQHASRADEDEEGPTTIMGHGHSLMDDIRRAVAEATTPPPSPGRDPMFASPRGTESRESAFDDPTTFSRRTPMPRGTRTETGSDGPTRVGLPPNLRAPLAQNPAAKPSPPPTPPTPLTSPPQQQVAAGSDQDNLLVLLVSLVGLVLVAGAVLFVGWYAGVIRFDSSSTAGPTIESVAPAQPSGRPPAQDLVAPPAPEGPLPGEPDPEPAETEPAEPASADPAPRPPSPSQLVPGDVNP